MMKIIKHITHLITHTSINNYIIFLIMSFSILLLSSCSGETCGNGFCDTKETIFATCPQDCGLCRGTNEECNEIGASCCEGLKETHLMTRTSEGKCEPDVCGTVCIPCGNGICDINENDCNCPSDCVEFYCIDYDGGINYNQASRACIEKECKNDYSLKCNIYPCEINEYYCEGKEIKEKIHKCENGRMNNRCLNENLIYTKGETCISDISIEDCTSGIWMMNNNAIRIYSIDADKKTFDMINLNTSKTYKNSKYENKKNTNILTEEIGEIIVVIDNDEKSIKIKGTDDMVCSDSDLGKDIYTSGKTSLYTDKKNDECLNTISIDTLKKYIVTEDKNNLDIITKENIISKKINIKNETYTIIKLIYDNQGYIDDVILIKDENKIILNEGYKTEKYIGADEFDIELIDISENENYCRIEIDSEEFWINKEQCQDFRDNNICIVKAQKGPSMNLDKDRCEIIIGSEMIRISDSITEYYCENDIINNEEFICENVCEYGMCKNTSSFCKNNLFEIKDNTDTQLTNIDFLKKKIYDNGNLKTLYGTDNHDKNTIIALENPKDIWVNEGSLQDIKINDKVYNIKALNIKKINENYEIEFNINAENIKLNMTECTSYNDEIILCIPEKITLNSKNKNNEYINIIIGDIDRITKYNNPKLEKIC